MFIDKVRISVKAGAGGNGAVAFHREKYVAAGGPDGGDGGNGGSIVLHVDDNLSTLMDFRYKRKYSAPNGENGQGKRCRGKNGENLIIKVPRGTVVRDLATNEIIKDMSDSDDFVLCKGGRGGAAAGATSISPRRRGRCRALPSPACPARATSSFWNSSCSRTSVLSASRMSENQHSCPLRPTRTPKLQITTLPHSIRTSA